MNYLKKFKNEKVQNLKKHISTSVINNMPDSFTYLNLLNSTNNPKKHQKLD